MGCLSGHYTYDCHSPGYSALPRCALLNFTPSSSRRLDVTCYSNCTILLPGVRHTSKLSHTHTCNPFDAMKKTPALVRSRFRETAASSSKGDMALLSHTRKQKRSRPRHEILELGDYIGQRAE